MPVPAGMSPNYRGPANQPLSALETMVAVNNGPGIIAPDKPTIKAVVNRAVICMNELPPKLLPEEQATMNKNLKHVIGRSGTLMLHSVAINVARASDVAIY